MTAPVAWEPPNQRALRDLSFRTKLLVSLMAAVGLLGAASLLAVRVETGRQVDLTAQRAAERERRSLAELEAFRRAELDRTARRLTGSIRVIAAFDAALADGDTQEFLEHLRYELQLAEFNRGLVAFMDGNQRPFLALLNGEPTPSSPDQSGAFGGESDPTSGYRVFQGHLFTTQAYALELFGTPVGTLVIGFHVDDGVASRLAAILDGDVCFAAAARCVAQSEGVATGPLGALMAEAAGINRPRVATIDGEKVALASSPLAGNPPVHVVVAVPLTDVLRPFERIRFVQLVAVGAAVVLALVLGAVLATVLTRPIATLVAATERVRRGDYDFTVPPGRRDELGRLALAFNQMLRDLLMKERYRGVLDKVVSPSVAEELLRGDIALGGETRELSVLFADVRGFTTMTEAMDPADVVALMNEWFEVAAGAIAAHGGVVDKYVGDQVMAIFGAPVRQEDHAGAAVRAAVALRDATAVIAARRRDRAMPALQIGIGVNTGRAVAGNVGSMSRLNYTVLGGCVNVAARLCSEAGAGELLVSEETYRCVAQMVVATAQPARILKGFSRPVTPFRVESIAQGDHARRSGLTTVLVLAFVCLHGAQARAQVLDPPTLSELGVRFASDGGLVQVEPAIRFELDAFFPPDARVGLIASRDPFLAPRGRLFVDLFLGRRLYAMTEVRADRGDPPHPGPLQVRVQQGFVRWAVISGDVLSLQAGKFVSPFGAYPQRARTVDDPFIRPPLLYDHRTVMQSAIVPGRPEAVFGWRTNPLFRATGLPVVWDTPYPLGATAATKRGRWTVAGGVVNSSPSADPEDWTRTELASPAGPSLVGRLTYQPIPELQAGASYSRGSYLAPEVVDALGPVATGRQQQEAIGFDATVRRGFLDVRGELVFNRWSVFRLNGDPRDYSYFVEAKQRLSPGLFVAVRFNEVRFLDVEASPGQVGRWDDDTRRWQLSTGYRLGRNSEVRVEWLHNQTLGNANPADAMVALQWWLAL